MKPRASLDNRVPPLVKKTAVWIQIALQLVMPVLPSLSLTVRSAMAQEHQAQSPFSVDRQATPVAGTDGQKPDDTVPYSATMSSVASALSDGNATGAAVSAATGYASDSVQQWLSQFGTARVQLNVDDNGNWDDSAVDLLVPLYKGKKDMLFTQLGLRAPDGRTTGNFGMGVRTFYTKDWMFGANVFLDDDFTGKNRRVGIGGEAWTNYLKLSANTYMGTTDWHDSRDFNDYEEKPADGFDLRAEGYLPAYPQLGAKLMYEQYYGDQVALFDKDDLQSNPHAITVGLNYTPVPLITLETDYKRGQDDMDEAHFGVEFRYALGQKWEDQISPAQVAVQRSLEGSRYDLVERNNEIVMQYRKKEAAGVSNLTLQVVTSGSPADGLTPDTAQVTATDKNGYPVRNAAIAWTTTGSATLASTTGVTNDAGVATVNFTDTQPEVVNITATSGAASATQSGQFIAAKVSKVVVNVTEDGAISDGQTPDHAVATVTDINGNPVSNQKVSWHLTHGATLKNTESTTDEKGQVDTDLVSTTAGGVIVAATAVTDNVSGADRGHFVADPNGEVIDTLKIIKNNSAADGQTKNVAKVTVKDRNGRAVKDANVSLKADKSTVTFGAAQYQTNALGQVDAAFTDTVSETLTLTATLDNGNNKTTPARFLTDRNSAALQSLKVVKDNAPAGGTAKRDKDVAQVYVMDGNNNPVKGMAVKWSTDKSTVTLPSESKTDMNGRAVVAYTDTIAEPVTLTAALDNGSTLNTDSTFTADSATAVVDTLDVTPDSSVAGTTPKTGKVTVKDSGGNLVANTTVTFDITKGAAVFDGDKQTATATTDEKGEASITFTDKTAEIVTLSAKAGAGDAGKTKDSTFTADSATAKVSDLTVTTGAISDGNTTNQATATVTDLYGNQVKNVVVNWTVDGSAKLSDKIKRTGEDGKASVTLTDSSPETVNVVATLLNGSSQSKQSEFVGDYKLTSICSDSNANSGCKATANGTTSATDKVTLTNNGKPVANAFIEVTVSNASSDLRLSDTTLKTDSNGSATLTATDKTSESPILTYSSEGVTVKSTLKFYVPELTRVEAVIDTNGHGMSKTDLDSFHGIAYDQENRPMEGRDLTMSMGMSCPSAKLTDESGDTISSWDSTTDSTGSSVEEGYIYSTSTSSCTNYIYGYNNSGAQIQSNPITFTFSK